MSSPGVIVVAEVDSRPYARQAITSPGFGAFMGRIMPIRAAVTRP